VTEAGDNGGFTQQSHTTMTVQLKKPAASAIAVHAVDRTCFDAELKAAPATTRRWLQANNFSAAPDSHTLVPAADGSLL
jgi:leucyl aminopeptidase